MNGKDLIHLERHRQEYEEGWSPEIDDDHTNDELVRAAKCYADSSVTAESVPTEWPWDSAWWKPTTRKRNLEKAGALLLAEMDRRERAGEPESDVERAFFAAMLCAEEIDDLDE